MNFYEKEKHKGAAAKFEAQKIAFAPFVFQAALALRDLGILEVVEKTGQKGALVSDLARQLGLSEYGVKVLAEAGLGLGLLLCAGKHFRLADTGYFILRDAMTRVNMDFVRDVNYRGAFHLQDAVRSGKPEGLKVFGNWPTIYEALAELPAEVRKSWFAFDHFYSDAAFGGALPLVFKNKPRGILDIGGNTGKWALQCVNYDPDVKVTIADLPGQLRMAEKNISKEKNAGRINYHAVDLLDPASKIPEGHDAVWMSQFLDCFSKQQIVSILNRARGAMKDSSRLYILETYWDRQKHEAAAFCLQQTSLYFTCMANGNSQMYHSDDMKECLSEAGLQLIAETDDLGISHTLFECKPK